MKIVRKYLFFLLIVLLPVNLGKHLDVDTAYISGIIVDYLVPVIYVQDIIAFLLVIIWIFSRDFKNTFRFEKSGAFLAFFIFSVFLSFLLSEFPLTSFVYFFRLLLYVLVGIYILNNSGKNKDFELDELIKILAIPVIYSSLLGIAQFIKQESVFNNYLVLGEQPYNNGLKAILKENFLNKSFIPPYSLFRHPNTFAGFLSLLLPFLWFYWPTKKQKLFWISFILGFICLFLTFSIVAMTAFILSMLLILFKTQNPIISRLTLLLPTLIVLLSLLLPLFTRSSLIKNEPSLYRRVELLNGAYSNLTDYVPFGIGIGTSTSLFKSSVFLTRDLSFFQPVHNIFVLTLLESGAIAFISLLLFMYFYYVELTTRQKYLLVLYIQLAVMGSYDHYLITMHQPLLLLCLLFALIRIDNRHLLGKK
jgi:hypothetical protein